MDRAIGVVVGSAVGDALGAGYEFAQVSEVHEITMRPGRLTGEPAGFWTDDTAMAIAILEIAATHGTLIGADAVVAVGERFLDWYRSKPSDVGGQARAVLEAASSGSDLGASAARFQRRNPDRAGNGSLMRTGPVALAHLGADDELVTAARSISALTHLNAYAMDACVLWTIAIDRTVRTGRLEGPLVGLSMIDEARRGEWESWIMEAETLSPRTFNPNGYVVSALQAAWSAIVTTHSSVDHFEAALRQAVAIGDDTDTVAAIAGSLLGARYGASAIPFEWRDGLGGWPEHYRSQDLSRLAVRAVLRGGDDE